MFRIYLRLVIGIMISVVVSASFSSPAHADVPPPFASGAHIERDIFLERYAQNNASAWIEPVRARSIVLAAGKYDWWNEFYAYADGRNYVGIRTIDLAAGEYTWNCRVWFDSETVSTYWSDCYLYRIATGDYAFTSSLKVDARYGTTFAWRSQLVRMPG